MSSLNTETKFNAVYKDIEHQPKTSLGYSTNNKYNNFPPLMSDGRSVGASFQPESVANDNMIKSNGIESNWQYRRFLTKNAKDIIEYNFKESCNDTGYIRRHTDAPILIDDNVNGNENTFPHKYDSILDNDKPRGYVTSDLKSMYLSREQLYSKNQPTVLTQEELLRRGNR